METLLNVSDNFVTYSVDGKAYEGYYISPFENAPLVLIVHDWNGLDEYEIKRVKMLNDLGYAAFAIDLFGKGVKPTTVNEKMGLTGALYKDRVKMHKLLEAGYKAAKNQGAVVTNAVGIGYCFGGAALLEMARTGGNLKGFVSFHGGLATPQSEDYKKTKGSILIFQGGADKIVGMSEFAELQKELEEIGLKYEMTIYSGAPHAFTVFETDGYDEEADKNSWKRLVEFLKETLD